MTLSVHYHSQLDDKLITYIQDCLHETITLTTGDTLPDTPDFDVLIAGRPTDELLSASPNVRMLIIPFAGMPDSTRELMKSYPQIAVHNLHHNAPPTAEMALSLLLATAKRTIPVDRDLRNNDWTKRYEAYAGVLLHGKTALVLGYGSIGQHLGVILKAMGMRVLGIRRRHVDEAQHIYAPDKLHDLLPQADVLIVAVPGTDDTEGMIGAEEIALMPQGAILVNIGRGKVVDQYALYDALKSGHLHGAGLDVWYHYPHEKEAHTNTPPADVPFHELDNIVMSPHRGGFGGIHEIEEMRLTALADMLNKAATGEPVPHQVSLELGY